MTHNNRRHERDTTYVSFPKNVGCDFQICDCWLWFEQWSPFTVISVTVLGCIAGGCPRFGFQCHFPRLNNCHAQRCDLRDRWWQPGRLPAAWGFWPREVTTCNYTLNILKHKTKHCKMTLIWQLNLTWTRNEHYNYKSTWHEHDIQLNVNIVINMGINVNYTFKWWVLKQMSHMNTHMTLLLN